MNICPCMIREQPDGSEMCIKCHGDIHACDCPLIHSLRCVYYPMFHLTAENQEFINQINERLFSIQNRAPIAQR